MTAHEEKTIEAMWRNGGSFVKALTGAYRLADSVNRARLRTAFSDYWAYYGVDVKNALFVPSDRSDEDRREKDESRAGIPPFESGAERRAVDRIL
jgi:hypothetical protein